MAQALYRKWRPRTFDEVVGQEHVVRTLRNALFSGRVRQAYLFAGPRGTGKTTTARLLAKAINCLAPEPAQRPCNECDICRAINEGRLMDLIEIDAASNTGVDDVRELRERVGYRPSEAQYKVYVIDEVHMLSNAAFNALLKTLEEPPAHAIFVLATTEPQRIPATVLSRCQRFDFRRIPLDDVVTRLQYLVEQEGFAAELEALALVARQATGSMRDAESLLDQLAAYNEGGITLEVVRAALGTGTEETVAALANALASADVGQGLEIINQAVVEGTDPRQFARQVTEYLRALLLTRLGSRVTSLQVPDDLQETFRAQAGRFTPHQLARAVRLFSAAATEARTAWQPQLPLELAFVEATLEAEGDVPPAAAKETTEARKDPRSAPAAASSSPPEPSNPTSATTSSSPGERSEPIPPSPAAGPPAAATENALSLEEIKNRWSELLEIVRPREMRLEALLRSGRPIGVERDAILIGFQYQFHKDKVEEGANRQILEGAFEELLGHRARVRCVLAPASQEANSNRRGPAKPATKKTDRPTDDKLVRAAIEELGAQVADRS